MGRDEDSGRVRMFRNPHTGNWLARAGEPKPERPEPGDDDYVITWVPGGYRVGGGSKWSGVFEDHDDALRAIAEHMEQEGYYSDVWEVNDHGNLALWTLHTDCPEESKIVTEWV